MTRRGGGEFHKDGLEELARGFSGECEGDDALRGDPGGHESDIAVGELVGFS